MSQVAFDERVATELLRYARMVVARGYIHNSLGNIAVRAPHPDFSHGLAYTKHAEVSLEEMTIDNVVVTDIPTPALLHGHVPTSVVTLKNRTLSPVAQLFIDCLHELAGSLEKSHVSARSRL